LETLININLNYRVPFQQALSLVANRTVYLENGFAYVPFAKFVSIIVSQFRANLSHALTDAANSYEVVGSDSRIAPLIQVSK